MTWRSLVLAAIGLSVGACGTDSHSRATSGAQPADPQLTAKVLVGERHSGVTGVAAGGGAVWVSSSGGPRGTLSRIDPRRNEVVAELTLEGGAADVAAGAGAVWVPHWTRAGPELARIDARSNEVAAVVPLARSGTPNGVAVGEGGVWVSVSSDPSAGDVVRIDPQTNRIVARISTRGYAGELLAGAGAVWVLSHPDYTDETKIEETSLHRIDPQANQLVGTPLRAPGLMLGGSVIAPLLAADRDAVWVGAFDDEYPYRAVAYRIEASTGDVRHLPLAIKRFFPIAVAEGGVWFVGPGADLSRLDPDTQRVDATVPLGETIGDAAFDAGSRSFWMGTAMPGREQRPALVGVGLR